MATIQFALHTGDTIAVPVTEDSSLMELAKAHNVPGIDGDCGGCCACGTCHVIVDPAWVGKIAAIDKDEAQVLGMNVDRQPHSRLACQILATTALDGLLVQVPEYQF